MWVFHRILEHLAGEHVDVEDIHPKYENGILSFTVPKKEQKAVEEKNKFISIEG